MYFISTDASPRILRADPRADISRLLHEVAVSRLHSEDFSRHEFFLSNANILIPQFTVSPGSSMRSFPAHAGQVVCWETPGLNDSKHHSCAPAFHISLFLFHKMRHLNIRNLQNHLLSVLFYFLSSLHQHAEHPIIRLLFSVPVF